MSNQSGDTIFEYVIYGISYLGALIHWSLFFRKKSFSKVLESNILNGIIGISLIIVSFFLFKNEIFNLLLKLINNINYEYRIFRQP
jgi:hypothetical protein